MHTHDSWQRAATSEVLGGVLTVVAWILVGLSFLSIAFNGSMNLTLFLVSFLVALVGLVLGIRAVRRGQGGGWIIALSAVLLLGEATLIALIIYWLGRSTSWD